MHYANQSRSDFIDALDAYVLFDGIADELRTTAFAVLGCTDQIPGSSASLAADLVGAEELGVATFDDAARAILAHL